MGMCHVTIKVSDFDKSLEFYQKAVGLTVKRQFVHPFNNRPIAFLTPEEGGTAIELIGNDGVYSGGGISVGFAVEDLDAAHKEKAEGGFNPTDIIEAGPGVRFFFISDPDGVVIQFICEKTAE